MRWTGGALSVAGVAYLVYELNRGAGLSEMANLKARTFWSLVALSLVYAAGNLFLALGWLCLLRHYGDRSPVSWAIRTYAVSQLAKYLPGNVFHLAGRQALGAAAGVRNGVLVKTAVLEIVLISASVAIFFPAALRLASPAFPYHDAIAIMTAASLAVLAAWSFRFSRALFFSGLLYAAQVMTASAVFVLTFLSIAGPTSLGTKDLFLMMAAYATAWLAGLLTPGAPAGVGVRETVMLVLLADLEAEALLLSAVVAGRLVTVAGDIVFFLSSFVARGARGGSGGARGG